jgi:peptide/nickel transport system permease protein
MSIIIFLFLHLIPGNFVNVMLGVQRGMLTREQVDALYRQYGLDKPLFFQYTTWLCSILRGNMGLSMRTGRPVSLEILSRFPVTVELTMIATLLGISIGLSLGIFTAINRNKCTDFFSRLFGLIGLSIPKFWLGLVIILFLSLYFKWVPPMGEWKDPIKDLLGNLMQMIFPALTLGLGMAAELMRIARSSMLEVLGQDYIITAYSKGLSNMIVWLKHGLKNALIPIITFIGMQVGYLLGGAVVIESVFSLPGIGRLLLNSVYQRDYILVQGIVLFITLNFILINLLVDILYAIVDTRIRYE